MNRSLPISPPGFDELSIDENLYAEMYSAVVGIRFTLQELLEKSKAVYDLTRAISVKLGVRRADDYPPPRTFKDPIISGPFAGKAADPKEYEALLEMYYQRRGWDLAAKLVRWQHDPLQHVVPLFQQVPSQQYWPVLQSHTHLLPSHQ